MVSDLGEQDMSKHIPQGRFRRHGPECRAVLPSPRWNIYLISISFVSTSENLNSGGTTNPHCVRGSRFQDQLRLRTRKKACSCGTVIHVLSKHPFSQSVVENCFNLYLAKPSRLLGCLFEAKRALAESYLAALDDRMRRSRPL